MLRSVWVIVLLVYSGVRVPSFREVEKCEVNTYTIPNFSEEALKLHLDTTVLHPEIVLAQAILESGNFSSSIFKENNNLFGMKLARKRRTLAIGKHRGHAVYRTWLDSVNDYILWQQQFKVTPIETKEDYLRLLDKMYSEDGSYSRKLRRLISV